MGLAHFLLGQSRSAVLSTLFLRPEAALHVRELARLTGVSPGSLHRELRNLAEMGLLLRQETGRQVYYRANPQCPIYDELAGLLRKTAGLVDVIRETLLPLADKIESMNTTTNSLVQKLWNYCNVLRDDGMSYGDYRGAAHLPAVPQDGRRAQRAALQPAQHRARRLRLAHTLGPRWRRAV
jgi:DNA-binding transcriptional ArsR family regulator